MNRYKIEHGLPTYDNLLNKRINSIGHKGNKMIYITYDNDYKKYDFDVNEQIPLQHFLDIAIQEEDYIEAARLRDLITKN